MTAAVDWIILEKTGTDLNLTSNHIQCFCHKVALILTAGLKSINLPTKGLTPEQHRTLGFVPCLVTIEEDNLEVTDPGTLAAEAADEEPIPDAQLDNGSDKDFNAEDKDANTVPVEVTSSKTSEILKKVDLVIKQITSSAARQSEFNSWSKKNNYNGPLLIAGYGICWNIKWQSRDRAYQGRAIINKIIENKRDRQERDGGKNFFQEKEITCSDWDVVKQLNDILSEFYFITKKMEVDHSLASLMLCEYNHIINFCKKQQVSSSKPEFKTMLATMITKTNIYLNEALQCNAVLLATMLNPAYRVTLLEVVERPSQILPSPIIVGQGLFVLLGIHS
ncbi:hypothetical protein PCASD_12649 [Puccinia coronata f. sp. avenae]|uniref:hAT-like transposase RNase-H fold domain-containing protein n=1 Tax=Puccinia coronata f. sp. avenae TaxID=200324 RepID=A0A2N5UAS8_9BASI|nr:hypothetical protein PCASD_12649 [Puccinia coronata f. sp. avenae]